ncbi:hypothetical protein [Cupriavidus basilensis]
MSEPKKPQKSRAERSACGRTVDVVVNRLLNALERGLERAGKVGEPASRHAIDGNVGKRPLSSEAHPLNGNIEAAGEVTVDTRRHFKATVFVVSIFWHPSLPVLEEILT